jgi:hypothetical protein
LKLAIGERFVLSHSLIISPFMEFFCPYRRKMSSLQSCIPIWKHACTLGWRVSTCPLARNVLSYCMHPLFFKRGARLYAAMIRNEYSGPYSLQQLSLRTIYLGYSIHDDILSTCDNTNSTQYVCICILRFKTTEIKAFAKHVEGYGFDYSTVPLQYVILKAVMNDDR